MPGKRRRSHRGGDYTRRTVLLAAGGLSLGGFSFIQGSDAFTSVVGSRESSIEVANQGDGIIGITPMAAVKKNSREPLVEFENNYGEPVTITVTLSDGSEGTLYDPDNDAGSSVTFTLLDGNSGWVDLTAAIKGSIPYDVSVTAPNFSLDWSGVTDAEAGNIPGAIYISSPSKDKEFIARRNHDYWELRKIDVRDDDGDADLDRIEIEITEQGGGEPIVASKTIDSIPGNRYAPKGTTMIHPDDASYDITNGTGYNLDFKAYDADGNFAVVTLSDTA